MTDNVLKKQSASPRPQSNVTAARRYLALWFPFLSADRLRHTSPRNNSTKPDETPVVFVQNRKGALQIASFNAAAMHQGIKLGTPLSNARALIPDLIVHEYDPQADADFLLAGAEACEIFTPLVAIDGLDGLILDITGCTHLFGGEDHFHSRACQKFIRRGWTVRASIASAPDAAHAFARFAQHKIVAAGQEAILAGALPVHALGWDSATTLALTRAGLRTLGDLAERPSQSLASRFGKGMVSRLHRIMGWEDIRITPIRAIPACIADKYFAEPLLDMAALENALSGLCDRICLCLEDRGQGGRQFEASFFRSDNQVKRVTFETGAACRDTAVLMRLFHLRMESLADPIDPGFGFDAIRLGVLQAEAIDPTQVSLERQDDSQKDSQALVDRLVARLGSERILQPVLRDTHNPARSSGWISVTRRATTIAAPALETDMPAIRPLTLFDPPQFIEAMAEVPDGPPMQFRWRRMLHHVTHAEGPERISPEWWRQGKDAATRDYYRVEDAGGHRFWIFREGLYENIASTPRWFLHGLFV